MRKIYLLFLFILCGITGTFAQTSGSEVLNESFEGAIFPPDNWLQKMASGTVSWSQMADPDPEFATDNKVISFEDYGNMDAYFITPQLYPTSENNQLEFRVKSGKYHFSGVELKVLVSTDYTNTDDFTTELLTLESGAAASDTGVVKEWVTHTIDLSDFNNQPVYVAFEAVGYTRGNFCIDDVSGVLVSQYENDLQVQDIVLPGNDPFIMENDEVSVSSTFKNNGTLDITDKVISVKIDGVESATETISLLAGEEITITKVLTLTKGNHYISFTCPDDDFLNNNEQGGYVMAYPTDALLESFEGESFPPMYWTSEGSWASGSYNSTHGTKNINCYKAGYKLITPKVNVLLGDSLCFDAVVSGTLEVASSVDGINWDVIESIELSGVYTANTYTIHFDDLENTDLVGKRYFAFELQGQYPSAYLDNVYGPAMVPVTDDFEMQDFQITNTASLYEGSEISFTAHVKNKGIAAASKNITLSINDNIVVEGITTGVIQPDGEEDVNFTWTPEVSYANAVFTAAIDADDYDGNNVLKQSVLIYSTTAMTLPYETDFEDLTQFPDFWSVGVNNGTTWQMKASDKFYSPTTTAHSGRSLIYFEASKPDTKVDLITPNLDLSERFYKVSFWLFREDFDYYMSREDKVDIYVSDVPNADNATLFGTVNRSTFMEPVIDEGGWHYYEFWADCENISEGFFIFQGVSSGSYRNVYIDDLKIEQGSSYDLSVIEPENHSVLWGNETIQSDIDISFANSGALDVTNATINWSIDEVEQPDVIWSGVLAYNDTISINIASALELSTNVTHTIDITIVVDGETVTDNNSKQIVIDARSAYALPYAEGFESSNTSFDYWTNVDADGDGFKWELSTENYTEGSQAIRSASFDDNNGEGLSPDNWLITPGILISTDAAQITFDVGTTDAQYFAEKYEVLVSESMDLDSFTPLYTETFEKAEFKTVSVDLNNYKNKVVFIAFRHYDTTEKWFLNLDNVKVYSLNKIATFTVTANSLPLADAQISIEGIDEPYTTNAEGKAYIDIADGVYNYTISMDGYTSAEGQFEMAGEDISVDVTIVATAISQTQKSDVKVYPNPFSSQINISSANEIASVSLYNAAGIEVIKQKETTIQTGGLARGIYLLVIEYANGDKVIQKLTK
nr:choice-of-anchor J domain-containing protein [uncultured Carboxylicivirga sp.]